MSPVLQSWLQLVVLVIAILAMILHIDKRFDSLERSIGHRFDDMRLWVQSELKALRTEISAGFQRLEERVGRLETRVAKIEERLDYPVERVR